MPVCAITFDFWCTLFQDVSGRNRQELRADAFVRATGASRKVVLHVMDQVAAEFFRHHVEEQRTLTPLDAVRMTARQIGTRLSSGQEQTLAQEFGTAILEDPPVPVDGALDAVRAAAARVPVAVISDSGLSPGSSLSKLLANHGFLEYLDVLVFSDEVGVAKPQRPMFDTAAERLNVDVADLLHIGDLEVTDVAGAKGVGAQAALFAGVNASNLDDTQADHTFTCWPDFVSALPQLLG